jgi:hypothetical protein
VADRSLFEDVADVLHGATPGDLGEVRSTHHRHGIKIWVEGTTKPPREHYEAQVVGRQHVPGASSLALEVGFHSEHPDESDNEAVLAALIRSERSWRKQLGKDPFIGTFLGPAAHWRRVSEIWPDPDMSDPELVFEVAARLTDYVTALEPFRGGLGPTGVTKPHHP